MAQGRPTDASAVELSTAAPPESTISRSTVNGPRTSSLKDNILLLIVCVGGLAAIFLYSKLLWTAVENDDIRISVLGAVLVFFVLMVISFVRAQRTGPPIIHSQFFLSNYRIPRDIVERFENAKDNDNESIVAVQRCIKPHIVAEDLRTRKDNGLPAVCKICNILQPLRTYHCATCGRCVVRKEGHNWLFGQCVHYANSKFATLTYLYSLLIFSVIFGTTVYIEVVGSVTATALLVLLYSLSGLSCAVGILSLVFFVEAICGYTKELTSEDGKDAYWEKPPTRGSLLQNLRASIGKLRWCLIPKDAINPQVPLLTPSELRFASTQGQGLPSITSYKADQSGPSTSAGIPASGPPTQPPANLGQEGGAPSAGAAGTASQPASGYTAPSGAGVPAPDMSKRRTEPSSAGASSSQNPGPRAGLRKPGLATVEEAESYCSKAEDKVTVIRMSEADLQDTASLSSRSSAAGTSSVSLGQFGISSGGASTAVSSSGLINIPPLDNWMNQNKSTPSESDITERASSYSSASAGQPAVRPREQKEKQGCFSQERSSSSDFPMSSLTSSQHDQSSSVVRTSSTAPSTLSTLSSMSTDSDKAHSAPVLKESTASEKDPANKNKNVSSDDDDKGTQL